MVYELSADPCKKPKLRSFSHYVAIKRHNEEKAAWVECDQIYSTALLADFDELKSSVQLGLTEPQARKILFAMALIQNVLEERHKVRKAYHRAVERKFSNTTLQPEQADNLVAITQTPLYAAIVCIIGDYTLFKSCLCLAIRTKICL